MSLIPAFDIGVWNAWIFSGFTFLHIGLVAMVVRKDIGNKMDHDKKELYTEKVRRKQLIEIERLMEHYLMLIRSQTSGYDHAVRAVYRSRDAYRSFLDDLHQAEADVIQAAMTTTRKGSKKERVRWFEKVKRATKDAKTVELARIFPE